MNLRSFGALAALALALVACDDTNLTWPDAGSYESTAPAPLACIPNLDGAIEAYEMAPTLNQLASYRVSPQLPVDSQEGRLVDLVGTVDDAGRRLWDWSAPDSSDRVADLEAEPLADRWYASEFPGGEFVLATDAGGRLEAVYSHDESGLMLYGLASSEPDPPEGRTLLVYEDPVVFIPFPLSLGQSWTQTGVIRNGTLQGLTPWSEDDVYESSVDAAGELRLPDFTFTQALRLYTKVTVKPKAGARDGYTQHQYSFLFECFGEVARAVSPLVYDAEQDPGKDFSVAHEVRRLGWF
ncbi:MAG: hypothetical protein EP329_16885 [Deltaproteobacteria bacterium]|nr:MAG: hypothetical protein EP329_16885 [Deltaproteobacteria bacterium]